MGQDDADIPRPVAIESDGTEQYRQMTVRERSRLRPQLLERLGWRYMPLWTIEVFTDPSACADRIGGYLGLEKPAPPLQSLGTAGFFLDDDVSTWAVDDFESELQPGAGVPEPEVVEPNEAPATDHGGAADLDLPDGGAAGDEAAEDGAANRLLTNRASTGPESANTDSDGSGTAGNRASDSGMTATGTMDSDNSGDESVEQVAERQEGVR
jgi:hypothetical protein